MKKKERARVKAKTRKPLKVDKIINIYTLLLPNAIFTPPFYALDDATALAAKNQFSANERVDAILFRIGVYSRGHGTLKSCKPKQINY